MAAAVSPELQGLVIETHNLRSGSQSRSPSVYFQKRTRSWWAGPGPSNSAGPCETKILRQSYGCFLSFSKVNAKPKNYISANITV